MAKQSVGDVGAIVRILEEKGTLISNGSSQTMTNAINCLTRGTNGWSSVDVKTELLSVVEDSKYSLDGV